METTKVLFSTLFAFSEAAVSICIRQRITSNLNITLTYLQKEQLAEQYEYVACPHQILHSANSQQKNSARPSDPGECHHDGKPCRYRLLMVDIDDRTAIRAPIRERRQGGPFSLHRSAEPVHYYGWTAATTAK